MTLQIIITAIGGFITLLLGAIAYLLKQVIQGQKEFNKEIAQHMKDTNIHKAVHDNKVEALEKGMSDVNEVVIDHEKRIIKLERV